MAFEETRCLLETMIEDAGKFCITIRSPTLFRMSVRASTIGARITQYGINHGPDDQPRHQRNHIAKRSVLHFPEYGLAYQLQQYSRPRVLHTIALLLSPSNNEELAEIKDFQKAIYKLRADRRDISFADPEGCPIVNNQLERVLECFDTHNRGIPTTVRQHRHRRSP